MTGRSEERPRTARDRWVPVAALSAAALLALLTGVATVLSPSDAAFGPTPSWRAWRIGPVHPAQAADEELATVRRALPAGARVGYLSPWSLAELMTREPDLQRFYAAQYALAPAVLKPIYLPECAARGAWACGLGRTQLLLATGEVVERAAAFGFEPSVSAGALTLLRRSPP